MTIRRARAEEGERLREIAVAAKGHWDYDPDFVLRWGARMDFSPAAVADNEIYVAEVDVELIAWAALAARHGVWWLDDLWVLPEAMGKGVGTRLFEHIAERARALGGPTRMEWQAEPNSVGFYEKVGGRYLRDGEPTSWGRVLPVMGLELTVPRVGRVTEWRWNPDTYLDSMRAEIPMFEELQDRAAAASGGAASRLLELGIGTGETARRVLALHPGARLTAIDSSPEMLDRARERFADADLRLARLEDPLPSGPFDLVYSTLAVHHLDGAGKRDLFDRVAAALVPGGRFVLADVVVPPDPADQQIEIDWVMDLPDTLADQLEWLRDAGFDAAPTWTYRDLAVVAATVGTVPMSVSDS